MGRGQRRRRWRAGQRWRASAVAADRYVRWPPPDAGNIALFKSRRSLASDIRSPSMNRWPTTHDRRVVAAPGPPHKPDAPAVPALPRPARQHPPIQRWANRPTLNWAMFSGRLRTRRSRVPHRTRERVPRHCPAHVALPCAREVPEVRRAAFVRASARRCGPCRGLLGSGVVHYSVQDDHAHFLVEANGPAPRSMPERHSGHGSFRPPRDGPMEATR